MKEKEKMRKDLQKMEELYIKEQEKLKQQFEESSNIREEHLKTLLREVNRENESVRKENEKMRENLKKMEGLFIMEREKFNQQVEQNSHIREEHKQTLMHLEDEKMKNQKLMQEKSIELRQHDQKLERFRMLMKVMSANEKFLEHLPYIVYNNQWDS